MLRLQLWARKLANGDVAVALYNKGGSVKPMPQPPCEDWTRTQGSYFEACGGAAGNIGEFTSLPLSAAEAVRTLCYVDLTDATSSFACRLTDCAGVTWPDWPRACAQACCSDSKCAGFSFDPKTGSGYYKANLACGTIASTTYDGYAKPSQIPSGASDMTVRFSDLNLFGEVSVFDVWTGQTVGRFTDSYTAKAVPFHGSAFLRLSSSASH